MGPYGPIWAPPGLTLKHHLLKPILAAADWYRENAFDTDRMPGSETEIEMRDDNILDKFINTFLIKEDDLIIMGMQMAVGTLTMKATTMRITTMKATRMKATTRRTTIMWI